MIIALPLTCLSLVMTSTVLLFSVCVANGLHPIPKHSFCSPTIIAQVLFNGRANLHWTYRRIFRSKSKSERKMELTYWIMFLANLLASVQAMMTYLERGSVGYIHCPFITSEQYSLDRVDAMYWYLDGCSPEYLVASHLQGRVNVQNADGVYDIDGNYSLVVHNVTDSMEGNYIFKLKPIGELIQIGNVPVAVKVTSRPHVVGCDDVDGTSSSTCEVKVDATQSYKLTCIVENAKPAVTITIARLLGGNIIESVNNIETRQEHHIEPETSTNPSRFKINNTFTTSASISVPFSDGVQIYRCEASGVAVGSANNHVTVTIRRIESKAGNDDDAKRNAGDSLTFTHSVLILMASLASTVTRRACY